tara:strand:+ start:3087 stop:3584 length:498 start_codon:yes stop_codon:yes gene_type:complete
MKIVHLILGMIQTGEFNNFGRIPEWDFNPNFIFKVLLAAFAGLLIGMEREYKGKAAGLKTNILVAVGACTFVSLSLKFFENDTVDITRVLSQVVIGVGFLGGGVILKKENAIHGLTTAATVWCSAAAGCIAAFYLVTDLILFTCLVLLVNIVFGWFDNKVGNDMG